MNAIEKGDYAKGVAELQKASELEPRDIAFRSDWLRNREVARQRLLNQADKEMLDGKLPVAEQYYRTILQFEPGNARAVTGLEKIARIKTAAGDAVLARAALEKGEPQLAGELSSRALENDPNQVDAKAVRRDIEVLQANRFVSAPTLDSLYRKPINLEFRDASVKMVFDALARTTGINFIFDRDVRGDQRTTVFLRQTTLEDAIDVILTTNQLEKKILNSSSVLIYPAGPRSREYQDLVVRAFYLSNAEAKNTATLLKTVLKVKEIFVDDKMNMLVLREPPETIALAEKLISLHDLDQPEVMLEVEVLEVTRSRLLDLGIKVTDKFTVTPLGAGTMKLSELGSINKDSLNVTMPSATVTFNADNRDTNLLANPRIRVRDREKARFMIGDKVPIVTTTNTPNGFSSENISYQDVGLKLEVEPEVRLHDEVGLRLSLEVSSLVSSIKTNNGSIAYQIGTRSVSSVLRLKDGETQVLAGLISDEDRSTANGLPFLNELPVLGRLFAAKQDNRIKTEIVLSITPRLIRNIQRKDPAAESFWSGTEASLRLKPLQLRSLSENPTPGAVPAGGGASLPSSQVPSAPHSQSMSPPSAGAMPVSSPNLGVHKAVIPGAPQMQWNGPSKGKIGVPMLLNLHMASSGSLRAAPLQVSFDPQLMRVQAVTEGEYFKSAGRTGFSYNIDAVGGRVSVGIANTESTGATGEGRLLTLELMPIGAGAGEINVMGFTPIGVASAIPSPAMPISHQFINTQ